MRIGFYTPSYPILSEGGVGTYTRNLARSLSERGHAVHVLTPGKQRHCFSDGGVRVHTTPVAYFPILDRFVPGFGACLRIMRAARRLVAEQRLDIIEFPNWEGTGLYFARWRSTPLVVRLHTSSLEAHTIDGTASQRLVRWDIYRERRQCRLADCLVTHSDEHRRRMAEEQGIDRNRIALIPHGITLAPKPSDPRNREPATILHVGRLEHRKGTLQLLHAVPAVLREIPEARFVLVGNDRAHCPGSRTHAQYLRDEFPLDVRQRVHLAGRLSDEAVEDLYRRATLFVGASIYESFGLSFIEAMRWGTPVVGTTGGAIPEVVENGRSGLLVAPGDSSALAEAIVALLKDESRRSELGEAGRQRVAERFTIDRMAADVERLFLDVIDNYRAN